MKIAFVDLCGEGDIQERNGDEYWRKPLELLHAERLDVADYASGLKTMKEKVDAFHVALRSDAELISFARGGYSCVEALPLIDWNMVKNSEKTFQGLSDFTHFSWMATLNGIKSFYGQAVAKLEKHFPTAENREFLFSFLKTGKISPLIANSLDSNLSKKDFSNERIIGGHLIITLLMLLRHPMDLSNRYLFLEYHPGGLNEELRDVGYYLEHLIQALQTTGNIPKGFIFGHSTLPSSTGIEVGWQEINHFCAERVSRLGIPIYEVDHFRTIIPFS
jgi:muramoyltetrapeptide carboxypeptidase LdcA involved in peptidoglycan recycling